MTIFRPLQTRESYPKYRVLRQISPSVYVWGGGQVQQRVGTQTRNTIDFYGLRAFEALADSEGTAGRSGRDLQTLNDGCWGLEVVPPAGA